MTARWYPSASIMFAGGQAAVRHHAQFMSVLIHNLGYFLGTLLRILSLFGLEKYILRPITPTSEGLYQSVVDDVNTLKATPLISKDVGIYGFIYNTDDGSLSEVTKRLPGSLGKAKHLQH